MGQTLNFKNIAPYFVLIGKLRCVFVCVFKWKLIKTIIKIPVCMVSLTLICTRSAGTLQPMRWAEWVLSATDKSEGQYQTRRSENDDTPQPLDQWTNSPFMGQQVGNWSICHALWPKWKPTVHPTLYPTHISFIPSQSTFPFLKYGY